MTRIEVYDGHNPVFSSLPASAHDIIAEAEQLARDKGLAKRSCLPAVLRQHVEDAGWLITDREVEAGVTQLDAVRRGQGAATIQLKVKEGGQALRATNLQGERKMTSKQGAAPATSFFERERVYPDADARAWYDRLVGLDEHKHRLLVELELLLYPERLADWSQRHHGLQLGLCDLLSTRAPLILLEGDVGCGKTALAETIGSALAERTGGRVHLLKVNTQVRGSGMVGEMTHLIVQAFSQAEQRADALKCEPVLLLIDEADALAAKRVDQHMHHEDKAGLNTLLQRIDGIRLGKRRIAVVFVTNRPDALDPAVRRRAALRLTFGRPDAAARAEIFRRSVAELDVPERVLKELVSITGADAEKKYGVTFTASDITDRLLPSALREAYGAGRALTASDIIDAAKVLEPSPAMSGGSDDGDGKA